MEKPTKALLPEIFNTKTDEDFAKVLRKQRQFTPI